MMRTLVFMCLLGVSFAPVAKKDRVIETKPLSDEEPGTKEFDHEAFLGEDEAKVFDELSEEESIRRLGVIVDRLNTDKNEFITKEELENWIRYSQKRYVMEDAKNQMIGADLNKNEKIEWNEYYNTTYSLSEADMAEDEEKHGFSYKKMISRDQKRWKAADEDGDNSLTEEEMQAFLHPEEYPHMKEIVLDETIQDIDKNNDGVIDMDEYIGDMYNEEEDEGGEPEWIKTEREQFTTHRDQNKDGKLDRDEVRKWIIPEEYNSVEAEAAHLIYEADADKDEMLTKEEILNKHDVFVGSQITSWGDDLKRHDEF